MHHQKVLDRILNGLTCPPISLPEFRYYLTHHECSLENLNFYEWYQNYTCAYQALPQHQQALIPLPRNDVIPTMSATMVPGSIHVTEPKSFVGDEILPPPPSGSLPPPTNDLPLRQQCQEALDRFIHHGAPDEINITHQVRVVLLAQAHYTTHPALFNPVLAEAMSLMRNSSLDGFMKWANQNITPRSRKWRLLGAALVDVLAVVALVVLICLDLPRVYRWALFPPILWTIGVYCTNTHHVCLVHLISKRRELSLLQPSRLSGLTMGGPDTSRPVLNDPYDGQLSSVSHSGDDQKSAVAEGKPSQSAHSLSIPMLLTSPLKGSTPTLRSLSASIIDPTTKTVTMGQGTSIYTKQGACKSGSICQWEDVYPTGNSFDSPLFQTTVVRGDHYYQVQEPSVLRAQRIMAIKYLAQTLVITAAVWVFIMFLPFS
ncbi:hypothetical protein H4R33_003567 [Dimargaris cristalligena]|nr:hypothetical protein H4R33_003567 [Dimargaris cristalligena]